MGFLPDFLGYYEGNNICLASRKLPGIIGFSTIGIMKILQVENQFPCNSRDNKSTQGSTKNPETFFVFKLLSSYFRTLN